MHKTSTNDENTNIDTDNKANNNDIANGTMNNSNDDNGNSSSSSGNSNNSDYCNTYRVNAKTSSTAITAKLAETGDLEVAARHPL